MAANGGAGVGTQGSSPPKDVCKHWGWEWRKPPLENSYAGVYEYKSLVSHQLWTFTQVNHTSLVCIFTRIKWCCVFGGLYKQWLVCDWRDGLEVESPHCSCRGPEFRPWHQHDGSQVSIVYTGSWGKPTWALWPPMPYWQLPLLFFPKLLLASVGVVYVSFIHKSRVDSALKVSLGISQANLVKWWQGLEFTGGSTEWAVQGGSCTVMVPIAHWWLAGWQRLSLEHLYRIHKRHIKAVEAPIYGFFLKKEKETKKQRKLSILHIRSVIIYLTLQLLCVPCLDGWYQLKGWVKINTFCLL